MCSRPAGGSGSVFASRKPSESVRCGVIPVFTTCTVTRKEHDALACQALSGGYGTRCPSLVKLEELCVRNRLTLLDAHAVFSSCTIGETILEWICQYIKEEKPI